MLMNDRSVLSGRAPLVFAGSPLDRGELVRRDQADLEAEAAKPTARCILLQGGQPLVAPDGALVRLPLSKAPDWRATGPLIYLGARDGEPVFACELEADAIPPEDGALEDARMASMAMPHDDAAIFAQAKSLFGWRERHRFCSNCGAPTVQKSGGARRICGQCETEHFPRTDPVVIMLAVDGDQCLLGRQSSWPEGIWSALAGFVEPAETLEEACARELMEEAGVRADIAATRYVMAQPWPFPSSLMVGLIAPVLSTEITIDRNELEDARWFSRDAVGRMLDGTHDEALMPPSIAIARRLAELWVDGQI
jgi:NAD+ diphosphatase